MWADCLFCGRQTNAAWRREEPVPSGEVERGALAGAEGKQAWAEGHGRLPGGSATVLPPPALCGREHKRKRVGWEALAPRPAEVGPLASNDYCVQ